MYEVFLRKIHADMNLEEKNNLIVKTTRFKKKILQKE